MVILTEAAAPPSFDWKRWPETEAVVNGLIATALEGNAFARGLAARLPRETGTSFAVWVDHLVIAGGPGFASRLEGLGYEHQPIRYAVGVPVFAHRGGIFPRIALAGEDSTRINGSPAPVRELAIKVDSVVAFSRAHDLGLEIVEIGRAHV